MIYFARHGQSQANKDKVFAGGKIDSPLTKKGIRQAKKLAKKVQKIEVDVIICSPLRRALDTAQIVHDYISLKTPIVVEEDLREHEVGELSGERLGPTGKAFWGTEGLEDPMIFRQRVLNVLKKIDKNYTNKTVLMVAHSGVYRIIKTAELLKKPDEFRSLDNIANAEIKKLDLDEIILK